MELPGLSRCRRKQLCPLLQCPHARLLAAACLCRLSSKPRSLSLLHFSPKHSQSRQTVLAVPVLHSVAWFLAGFYSWIKIDCYFISEIPMAAARHLPTGETNHALTFLARMPLHSRD